MGEKGENKTDFHSGGGISEQHTAKAGAKRGAPQFEFVNRNPVDQEAYLAYVHTLENPFEWVDGYPVHPELYSEEMINEQQEELEARNDPTHSYWFGVVCEPGIDSLIIAQENEFVRQEGKLWRRIQYALGLRERPELTVNRRFVYGYLEAMRMALPNENSPRPHGAGQAADPPWLTKELAEKLDLAVRELGWEREGDQMVMRRPLSEMVAKTLIEAYELYRQELAQGSPATPK